MLMNAFLAMKIHILIQTQDNASARKDSLKILENAMLALLLAALVSHRNLPLALHALQMQLSIRIQEYAPATMGLYSLRKRKSVRKCSNQQQNAVLYCNNTCSLSE